MSFVTNAILAALAAAVLLLIGLRHGDADHFDAALHPLSQSYELQWKDLKTARARAIAMPKLVIVGGSGALFGLGCASFTQALGAPCVNGALPNQPAPADLLAFARTLLRPGDVALLQLDTSAYVAPVSPVSASRSTRLFTIGLDDLLTAVAERLMAATGYSFYGPVTATPDGDRKGHARANVASLAEARAKETFTLPATVAGATRASLAAFLDWAKDNRILVVWSLPPTYDDWTIPDALLKAIPQLYTDAGVPFVTLPSQSRYPRDCFWDSSVRLTEECQAIHSKALAEALAPILKNRGYTLQ